jgi:hypothetical protein
MDLFFDAFVRLNRIGFHQKPPQFVAGKWKQSLFSLFFNLNKSPKTHELRSFRTIRIGHKNVKTRQESGRISPYT